MDRGLISFCDRKQINAIKTVKMFTKETGFKVEDNFARFASFVDKKIKSGELKGNDAPLNKDMWDESRRKQEEHTAEMKTFTYEHKAFYRKYKENNSALDSFFGKKEIQKPKQTESKNIVRNALLMHDTLEDSRLSYNDIFNLTNREFENYTASEMVANIVYCVTDEKGKNREERKNEKYYEELSKNKLAVFVKLADLSANTLYSKLTGSSMYDKYKKEFLKFKERLFIEEYAEFFNYVENL